MSHSSERCMLGALHFDMSVMALHVAPSAPLNLTFPPGGILNDSVMLTWSSPLHPNGDIQVYEVQVASYDSLIIVNTTDNTTTAVISDLTPGTQYNFSVRAFTVDFGPFSAQLSVQTADGENTPLFSKKRVCV